MNELVSDPEHYTKFDIGKDDLVTIYGELCHMTAKNDKGAAFRRIEGSPEPIVLKWRRIYALYVHDKLTVDRGRLAGEQSLADLDVPSAPMLPEITLRARMVSEFLEQENEYDYEGERYHRSRNDLPKFMRVFAMDNPALVEEARASYAAQGKKEKIFVTARQFQRWIAKFLESSKNPDSLSRPDRSVTVGSSFDQESLSFQLKYTDLVRTEEASTVRAAFEKMLYDNKALAKPHKMPSETTFQRLYNEGNDFLNEAGRSANKQRIKRKLETAGKGLKVSRPLQIVEMDEHNLDVLLMLTKNGIWEHLHEDVQKKIKEKFKRVWLSVALDAFTRSILGMKIVDEANTASAAVATLAMVAQNKDRIAALVGARSGWPQSGTPEAIHTDAGAGYTSARFEYACMAFTRKHRIPPSKHPHLRGRVERFFGTLNRRFIHLFSARTFSSPLLRDEYDAAKFIHLNDDEIGDLLVRLIVDCYHRMKHRALKMTPLEAWTRGSQIADGGVKPPPTAEVYSTIFGVTTTRRILNNGILIMGNYYSSPKLLEYRKKWFHAKLLVRFNEQDVSSIMVKHRHRNKWIKIPAVFDGLEGVTMFEWKETVRYITERFGTEDLHSQNLVQGALAVVREQIALSKKKPGVITHEDLEKKLADYEREMISFKFNQPQPYDYGSHNGVVKEEAEWSFEVDRKALKLEIEAREREDAKLLDEYDARENSAENTASAPKRYSQAQFLDSAQRQLHPDEIFGTMLSPARTATGLPVDDAGVPGHLAHELHTPTHEAAAAVVDVRTLPAPTTDAISGSDRAVELIGQPPKKRQRIEKD